MEGPDSQLMEEDPRVEAVGRLEVENMDINILHEDGAVVAEAAYLGEPGEVIVRLGKRRSRVEPSATWGVCSSGWLGPSSSSSCTRSWTRRGLGPWSATSMPLLEE